MNDIEAVIRYRKLKRFVHRERNKKYRDPFENGLQTSCSHLRHEPKLWNPIGSQTLFVSMVTTERAGKSPSERFPRSALERMTFV